MIEDSGVSGLFEVLRILGIAEFWQRLFLWRWDIAVHKVNQGFEKSEVKSLDSCETAKLWSSRERLAMRLAFVMGAKLADI